MNLYTSKLAEGVGVKYDIVNFRDQDMHDQKYFYCAHFPIPETILLNLLTKVQFCEIMQILHFF